MNTLIIEPFYTGSHAAWADGYSLHSNNDVSVLSLSGAHWKWRMHGGAVTLARRFLEQPRDPDLILATDMLDLGTFLALTRERTAGIPAVLYFHENQLTYPWSQKDRDLKRQRDRHYGFINFSSALAADRVYFNSHYHMNSFLGELPVFLGQFPDHRELGRVEDIAAKSEVLALGLDLRGLDGSARNFAPRDEPLLLWNHRWEYDKNPDDFFAALEVLVERGRAFDLVVLGETFDVLPESMERGIERMGDRVLHSGYVESREEYARWLWRADILPVTSIQDFFGAGVVEAVYCGCFPLLPRRLAFPELIPRDHEAACLYEDFDDFVERLDAAVCDIGSVRESTLRDAIKRFDWEIMAGRYDDAFRTQVSD